MIPFPIAQGAGAQDVSMLD
jgi:hypothetical protein